MKTAMFMLKRTLRRWPVLLLLLLAPIAAVYLSGTQSTPPAGLYMPEDSPISSRVAQHLLDHGYILCDDPETMRERVRLGELDCGAVFPEDFSHRVVHGQLDECIRFYQSPGSYTPELYQSHITAAVFKEYTPYLTAKAFQGTAVTTQDVVAEYEAMFASGPAFSFDVVIGDATTAPEDIRARSLAMGATAILLCAVVLAFCIEILERSFRPMLVRLGLRRCITSVLLPEIFCTTIEVALFSAAGLSLAGFSNLVLSGLIYTVLLTGFGLFFSTLFPNTKTAYVVLPLMVIGSAALCPIYTDPALLIPVVEHVRRLLPAYWLWLVSASPVMSLPIAVAVFALGLLCVSMRYKKRNKRHC